MRILIALEDPSEVRSLEAKLTQEGYEVVLAGNGSEAWLALQKDGAPKIAILARKLSGLDGLGVCREVRKHENMDYVYIVLVADPASELDDLRQGLAAGTDEFLIRPFDDAELHARLRAGRRILGLQQDVKASQEALSYQASHDPLTGVWNRAAILDVLRRELARGRREKAQIGLIAVEVDSFKNVSSQFGNLAGDAVLRGTARKLRAAIRPYDAIGRFDTDQFFIVVPGSDAKSVEGQAGRLRASVASEPIDVTEWGKNLPPDKAKLVVTISLGIALSQADQSLDPLVQAALKALERAKKADVNRLEVAPHHGSTS